MRYFTNITKDEFLTATFHNPRLLPPESRMLAAQITTASYGENIACCVYLGFDEKIALYWRLIALVISLINGLGAGFGTRNAEFGLEVGTAILAVLLVIQATLVLRITTGDKVEYM
jgi:hypothetical protein